MMHEIILLSMFVDAFSNILYGIVGSGIFFGLCVLCILYYLQSTF
jgi:hypothetical protein